MCSGWWISASQPIHQDIGADQSCRHSILIHYFRNERFPLHSVHTSLRGNFYVSANDTRGPNAGQLSGQLRRRCRDSWPALGWRFWNLNSQTLWIAMTFRDWGDVCFSPDPCMTSLHLACAAFKDQFASARNSPRRWWCRAWISTAIFTRDLWLLRANGRYRGPPPNVIFFHESKATHMLFICKRWVSTLRLFEEKMGEYICQSVIDSVLHKWDLHKISKRCLRLPPTACLRSLAFLFFALLSHFFRK